MQVTPHPHPDPVLLAARETRDALWATVAGALDDGTHVTLLRAYIHDWLAADDTVKKLEKEKRQCPTNS